MLTWGPGWYFQKTFFEGKDNSVSTPENSIRYDVEVSGHPSSHTGHLLLLRLKEQDYPGTKRIEDWPSWGMPILEWGKKQGAVIGYTHSGWGLALKEEKLPSYEMPPFDGIGANEYVVSVTHGLPEVYFNGRYAVCMGAERLVSRVERRIIELASVARRIFRAFMASAWAWAAAMSGKPSWTTTTGSSACVKAATMRRTARAT